MTSPIEWWRRASAAIKDKRSILLTMLPIAPRKDLRNAHMMAAIIRATSHDEHSIDYKNAGRVFAWARSSPSLMGPLMWAVSRRAERTRSWSVALKCLLVTHGLLLISSGMHGFSAVDGKLPFDLFEFHDRSSGSSWGFSAFVRAYFHFLDNRAIFLSTIGRDENDVEKLQSLLDLLMQIRPCADGMGVGLILEAMDCAVIEIFNVYSGICSGVASLLAGVLGPNYNARARTKGVKAVCVLRRAREQNLQLRSYFEVCKSLGVLNAIESPPIERIPDKDIEDLEKLVIGEISEDDRRQAKSKEKTEKDPAPLKAIVTKDWVVFEDEFGSKERDFNYSPFVCSASDRWQRASTVHANENAPWFNGNLIELM